MKVYQLTQEQLQALVDVLAEFPAKSVFPAINMLMALQPISEIDDPVSNANGEQNEQDSE